MTKKTRYLPGIVDLICFKIFNIRNLSGAIKHKKLLYLVNIDPLWAKQINGGMVVRYMPNSGHRGPPGTRVMTIFVFYVNPQSPNIEIFDVYGGL